MIFSFQRLVTRGIVASILLGSGAQMAYASPGEHGFAFGEPGRSGAVDRTIRVVAADTEFSIEKMHIHAGETIRFIVTNTGEFDHDFTIGPADLQAKHREEMMKMMENGDGMAKMHDDPNAVYLKPGETKELVWRFANTNELEFACNVPGHYESGMKGSIAPNVGHESGS